MGNVYYYSLGITGDELWSDPNDSDRLMVLYAGIQREQIAKSYKIQHTPGGRAFVRVSNGRRIYLDEALNTRIG
jgi:hypothetical protein